MSNKKLYKSSVNRMLCGVCGGIAEYFDIDPTLVRLVWVIITLMGGRSSCRSRRIRPEPSDLAEPESWRISLRPSLSRIKNDSIRKERTYFSECIISPENVHTP